MDTPASPANDVVTLRCDHCGKHHPAIYTCLNVWEAAEGCKAIYGWKIMPSDCPVVQAENREYQSQELKIESYKNVVLTVKNNKHKHTWFSSKYNDRRANCRYPEDMERLASDLLHKAGTKGMSSQLFSSAPTEVRSAVIEYRTLIEKLQKQVSP